MASEESQSPGTSPSSGPGTHPSASNYVPDLPLAEDLQALLGGGYLVEGFLGQGGMGAVYKGLQMPLKRPVAIKILQKRQAAGEEDEFAFEERFKREAYAMAALTHPHIVQVYDCGDAGENFLFISMELVEGGDLSDAIKAGLGPEAALKLIPQICDGLQAAHERGIVHRDVKPANIFLTKDGRAKVADFGLAKKFDAKNTLVTKAGLGMGTPDYAAPEQFDGVEDLDHRADIYSFGVMMYQMITGRLPRGATFKAPSQLAGVDARIDDVVKKAMESEREDRYQSIEEIKTALAQIAASPQAAATPVVAIPSTDARTSAVALPVRPAARTQGIAGGRPATVGRPTSPPVHRAATTAAARVTVPEKKKPNFMVIGSIAVVVVLGVGAMLMRGGGANGGSEKPAASGGTSAPSTLPEADRSVRAPFSSEGRPSSSFTSPPADGPLVPGKWVKLDWSKMNLKVGEVRGDTLILPAEAQITLPGLKMMNAVVSVKVRRPGGEPRGVQIRQRTEGWPIYAFAAVPSDGMPQGMIQVSVGGTEPKTTQWGPFPGLESDKEYDFEFVAIRDRYALIVDHRTVATHRDDRLMKPGGVALWAGRGTTEFRDPQVLLLDGVAEDRYPEFIKESLASARASVPAATQSSASAVTPSNAPATTPSVEFPPGQWVKVFTKMEDFSPGAINSGITLQDGWVVPPEKSGVSFKVPLTSNAQGIRARFVRSSKVGKFDLLNGSDGATAYTTGFQIAGNAGIYAVDGPKGTPQNRVAVLDYGKLPRPALGEEYTMEFYAVGGLLVARSGGALVTVTNPVSKSGSPGIYIDGEKVRDIEVINLDGMPKAEAMAVAGVDAAGNDVRALAAAREKQEREAKAQVDAFNALPELKALHEQFVKLQEERVTAPFQADVAKLNAGYLGAVDRAMTEEKAAGHADAVAALEGEKKLIGDGQPLPEADDASATEALKKLRGIYRASYEKLEGERAANLKALTEPLGARLTALETELVKKDRIPDAKTVREYREKLSGGASNEPAPADAGDKGAATTDRVDKPSAAPNTAPASTKPKGKSDAALSRTAAEYALSKGANITLGVNGKGVEIARDGSLPKGSWELWRIAYPLTGDLNDEDVQSATQAVELKEFRSGEQGKLAVTSLVPFRNTPRIEIISLTGYRAVGPEDCAVLSRLPLLADLRLQNLKSVANLEMLIGGLNLKRLELSGGELSAGDCAAIGKQAGLKWLNLGRTATDEVIGRLGGLTMLERLHAPFSKVTGVSLASLNPKLEKTLKVLAVGSDTQDSSATIASALARFPLLEDLEIRGEINAASFERLPKMEHLKKLVCLQATFSSQHAELVGQCEPLEELRIGAGQLTGAEIGALKRLKNLKTLTLQDNGISLGEDSLHALAAFKITKLELPESRVTGDQAAGLRQQMPKCAVGLVKAYR